MRKLKIIFALLPLLALAACSGGNGPEVTAEKFLKAVYTADFEGAKALCTEDTKQTIDLIAAFATEKVADMKKTSIKLEEKSVTLSEDGNSADVVFMTSGSLDLKNGEISEPKEDKVHLVKVDNKWLVENKLK